MNAGKIVVQLDFDGTVTVEDVSFLLLDTYGHAYWRNHLDDYSNSRIPVGVFNRRVFCDVRESRESMTEFVLSRRESKTRSGFREFIDYCCERDYKVIIVSNGLRFYIEAILASQGIENVEIHAAENKFSPEGMEVRYISPDGDEMDDGLKEAYTRELRAQGFYIIYIGDGASDIYPARLADRVFATGNLRELCRREDIPYTDFKDFFDIIDAVKC